MGEVIALSEQLLAVLDSAEATNLTKTTSLEMALLSFKFRITDERELKLLAISKGFGQLVEQTNEPILGSGSSSAHGG
jgi:hypothetical protein